MRKFLTSTKTPGGSLVESYPIEAPSTHYKFPPELVESARALNGAVWPNFDENSNKIPAKGATITELTDWIRAQNYTIPVRLPSKTEFVCVDDGNLSLYLEFSTIKDEATGELYVVQSDDARLWRLLEDYRDKTIRMGLEFAISEDGSLFLWPYLGETFSPAIDRATSSWVRVVPNRTSDGYRLDFRSGELPNPFWPLLTHEEIQSMAFQSRVIRSLDHPLIKKLGTRMSKSFVPSFVPLLPSQIPSKLMSESKPNQKISRFLGDQIVQELTDWISDRRYLIPVREPLEGEFVCTTDASDSLRHTRPTVTDEVTGDVYRVSHELIFETKARFVHLYGSMSFALTISSSGSMFLWPVMSKSLRKAIKKAEGRWVQVSFDKTSEARLLDLPQNNFPEPIWPEVDLGDIIDMGFHSLVIDSQHHPLIHWLHGKVIVFPAVSSTSP